MIQASSPDRPWAWDDALSLDDERNQMEGVFNPFGITALGGGRMVRMRWAQFGPVVVSDVTHNGDVRVEPVGSRSGYHLMLPLNGRVVSRYLGTDIVLSGGNAMLFRAQGPVSTWLRAGTRVLNARFDLSYVHHALESQLGERLTGQIPFAPVFGEPTCQGANLTKMLLLLSEQLGSDDSILLNPIVALPYAESLTQALLLTADSPYREVLDRQAGRVRSAAIRIAAELMETNPARPLTVAAIAAEAHVSVRALQEGFRRDLGLTPMAYLRDVRLRRAHADLRAADPSVSTVASIARRWHFAHLGRFAARYADVFGESPNATLRAPR